MQPFTIIGLIAAACTTIAYLPQAIKTIITKDTKSLSLLMYIIITVGVFLWLIYGIIIRDLPLILANAITFLFTATILVLKIKYK